MKKLWEILWCPGEFTKEERALGAIAIVLFLAVIALCGA